MGLLDRLTGKDKKKAEQQKAEIANTSLLNATLPYPTQQIAPQPQESNDDDLYSGFGAEDVAAPLATEDLEYDEDVHSATDYYAHLLFCCKPE